MDSYKYECNAVVGTFVVGAEVVAGRGLHLALVDVHAAVAARAVSATAHASETASHIT